MNEDTTQQIEPVRKTFLDVLKENFKAANRENYVHRLIYIGEHMFKSKQKDNIGDIMQNTVDIVNTNYNDEYLTGLLVCYPKYFCHILEGSEDSIIKHLLLLTKNQDYQKNLGTMKLLVCYHHINQRFLSCWTAISGKPPLLMDRINPNTDCEKTYRYVFNCIQKLYKLARYQREKLKPVENDADDLEDERSRVTLTSFGSLLSSRTHDTSLSLIYAKCPDCLPEYGLLEFLLTTEHTLDLQKYIEQYAFLPHIDTYREKVWPIPPEFVPLNIFDPSIDPVTDLPTVEEPESAGLE